MSRYDYDNISVIDIEFKKVRLKRISDVSFNFYPVIKVYFYVRTEDKEMNISEWYSVPGRYEVNESLWLFQDIQIYDYRKAVKSNMTNYLVPILSDYDEAAEAMLKKYQPEALNDPGCINAEQLAEAMGFTIEYAGLSKNGSIHGKAVFSDSNITLYDDNERSYIKRINANTILIDFNACKKRSGSRRDAIIHECVHIYFHRLFFRLQNRYREMLNDDSEFSFDNCFLKDEAAECVRVMERQAARITPRVLMPASSAKIKIEEFMQIFKPYNSFLQIEKTVKKLAEFFSVSIEMAKNRMIELGYTQARGVFDYVDGFYNAFVYYKLRGDLGLTDIALEAHIERSRLGRITNEAAEKRKEPTYREVLSLALTICPSAELAIDFIEKSGYNTNKTAEQKFITNLIYLLIGAGIDEFNFAMISAGYQPLYDDTPKSSKKAQ